MDIKTIGSFVMKTTRVNDPATMQLYYCATVAPNPLDPFGWIHCIVLT